MENDLANKIRKYTAELTGLEPELLTSSADFEADLNINKLELQELIAGLEKKLDFEIDPSEIAKIKNFGKLVTVISENLEE